MELTPRHTLNCTGSKESLAAQGSGAPYSCTQRAGAGAGADADAEDDEDDGAATGL